MTPPPLRDYQRDAVEWMRSRDKGLLWLSVGMGKTAITLCSLESDHLPALVVAPKRVAAETWTNEVAKWRPDLTIREAVGTPAQRKAALASGADLVTIGRDTLADAVPFATRFRTFIRDEDSSFKSNKAARWRAARKIAKTVPRTFGLTGTPAPNGYLDLWAQVALSAPTLLEPRFTDYRAKWWRPGRTSRTGVVWEWIETQNARAEIDERLADSGLVLSLLEDGRLQLPGFTVSPVEVAMPAKAVKAYESLKEDLVAGIELLGGVEHFSAGSAATLSSRLSQASAGFLYPDTDDLEGQTVTLHEAKLDALDEVIDAADGPVLVFVRYKWERAAILERHPEAKTPKDLPKLEAAWCSGSVPVLVAHPAEIGHGLNLAAGGHHIVWCSPPWSSEEWEQSNGRLNRPGQTKPVVASVLCAAPIDRVILDRVQGKCSVQDALRRTLGS